MTIFPSRFASVIGIGCAYFCWSLASKLWTASTAVRFSMSFAAVLSPLACYLLYYHFVYARLTLDGNRLLVPTTSDDGFPKPGLRRRVIEVGSVSKIIHFPSGIGNTFVSDHLSAGGRSGGSLAGKPVVRFLVKSEEAITLSPLFYDGRALDLLIEHLCERNDGIEYVTPKLSL